MLGEATYFDEENRRVSVTEPDIYPADEPDAAQPDSIDEAHVALDRRQAAAAILEILTRGATVKQAGQRAFILSHALRLGTCRTQRELAARLRLTPGRVSQLLNTLQSILTPLTLRQTTPGTLKIKLRHRADTQ
jgi:hypothetical protein